MNTHKMIKVPISLCSFTLCTVGEVFCDLHPEPLGAASLAQVHRATLLKDRSQVAVKVQHPYVRDNSYTDIDTIDVRTMRRIVLSVCNKWTTAVSGLLGN